MDFKLEAGQTKENRGARNSAEDRAELERG